MRRGMVCYKKSKRGLISMNLYIGSLFLMALLMLLFERCFTYPMFVLLRMQPMMFRKRKNSVHLLKIDPLKTETRS